MVGHERREREDIADFQLPIVDVIRAARSTLTFGGYAAPCLRKHHMELS